MEKIVDRNFNLRWDDENALVILTLSFWMYKNILSCDTIIDNIISCLCNIEIIQFGWFRYLWNKLIYYFISLIGIISKFWYFRFQTLSFIDFISNSYLIFFKCFTSLALLFQHNVLHLFFIWLKILFRISFSHSKELFMVWEKSYIFNVVSLSFIGRCVSPLTWINWRCWIVRVEKKGFSCLEDNVLRTVTIEIIGSFLRLLFIAFFSLCFSLSYFPPPFITNYYVTVLRL